MAGGGGEKSLSETPTWAVAVVATVFVLLSVIIEHSIHSLGKWFQKRNKKAMSEALEKIKAELMLLGFLSLLLTVDPETAIRYLLVGNEILSQKDDQLWHGLVPAMRKVKEALKSHGVHKVKVGTSLAMDVLESSYPPLTGAFRSDIAEPVMRPVYH